MKLRFKLHISKSFYINLANFCIILLSCTFPSYVFSASELDKLNTIKASSLLVIDENNNIVHSRNPDKLLIPASTVKLITSLLALDFWGREHRFKTNFYYDESINYLWIKGSGDPYLISEELDLIVNKLKKLGIEELDGIAVDLSYYERGINIDGQGGTLNPYDATVGALAANFNTINLRIYEDSVSSSEPQTPMTETAHKLSQGLSAGTHRINIREADLGPRYFSELLKAKLNRSGVLTDNIFIRGAVPQTATLLFVHENSHKLETIIKAMLEYSNNFVANQLFLNLGAEEYGPPANLEKSQKILETFIRNNFDWGKFILVEGAGLSRKNRLSAEQITDVLVKFKPFIELMPKKQPRIFAKTGTLKNVSTYAGYLDHHDQTSLFTIMINENVSFHFREDLAKELLN